MTQRQELTLSAFRIGLNARSPSFVGRLGFMRRLEANNAVADHAKTSIKANQASCRISPIA